jgi:acetyl esterase/lipase
MTEAKGVVFDTQDGRDLQLDVYRPPDTAPSHRMAVVQFHGGAYRLGSRAMMQPRAEALSALGFVCVAPDYRFVTDAPWPSQLQDAMSAIDWVRHKADDLDVDPTRVVVQGNSSGGHLALMVAATTDVAAVAATYALVELFETADQFPAGADVGLDDLAGLGRPDGAAPAAMVFGGGATSADAATASPMTHVSATYPPALFIHGTADAIVDPAGSRRMHQALLDVAATSELVEYAHQAHEFDAGPLFADIVAHNIAGFLRRTLIEPEAFRQEQAEHNPFFSG